MTTVANMRIPQGASFRFVASIVSGGPEDLTGYTGWMQIRPIKHTPEVLAEFTEAEITVNPITSQVVLEIPDTLTAEYDWDTGVYDLIIEGPEGTWRVIEGNVTINHSVTRED